MTTNIVDNAWLDYKTSRDNAFLVSLANNYSSEDLRAALESSYIFADSFQIINERYNNFGKPSSLFSESEIIQKGTVVAH